MHPLTSEILIFPLFQWPRPFCQLHIAPLFVTSLQSRALLGLVFLSPMLDPLTRPPVTCGAPHPRTREYPTPYNGRMHNEISRNPYACSMHPLALACSVSIISPLRKLFRKLFQQMSASLRKAQVCCRILLVEIMVLRISFYGVDTMVRGPSRSSRPPEVFRPPSRNIGENYRPRRSIFSLPLRRAPELRLDQ